MSLRTRKRRQNRLNSLSPATRNARSFLAPLRSRGLRNIFKSLESRDEIRPTRTVIAAPAERRRLVSQSLRLSVKRANKAVLDNNHLGLISGPVLGKIVVDLPRHHPICVLRRERREIMFAKHKAGKGGQRPRRKSVILRCE